MDFLRAVLMGFLLCSLLYVFGEQNSQEVYSALFFDKIECVLKAEVLEVTE